MKKLILISVSVLLSACAGGPVSQRLVAPIEAPNQVGVVQLSNQDIGLSSGVVAIVEEEGKIATNDPRLTCERVKRTGSHRVQRVCRTVAEFDAEAEQSQRHLSRLLRQGRNATGSTAERR